MYYIGNKNGPIKWPLRSFHSSFLRWAMCLSKLSCWGVNEAVACWDEADSACGSWVWALSVSFGRDRWDWGEVDSPLSHRWRGRHLRLPAIMSPPWKKTKAGTGPAVRFQYVFRSKWIQSESTWEYMIVSIALSRHESRIIVGVKGRRNRRRMHLWKRNAVSMTKREKHALDRN